MFKGVSMYNLHSWGGESNIVVYAAIFTDLCMQFIHQLEPRECEPG